ncbi:MAG: hypothetical protein JSU00_17840 [Acidobacteria bacterium]|nr:hypothetical protein [Acidobacteriota bacterium]
MKLPKEFGAIDQAAVNAYFANLKGCNALKSTGPRTPEGKAASSKNAIKHGLTARQVVITGENQADFDALLQDIADDRKPVGELEIQLVGEVAACTWRLARARAKEMFFLEKASLFDAQFQNSFERLLRYMSAIERQHNRALVRLDRLQNDRRNRESQPAPEEAPKAMAVGSTESTTSAPPQFVSQKPKTSPAAPAPHASETPAPPAPSLKMAS